MTLSNPRRSRGYNGLCTGDIHKLEEQPCANDGNETPDCFNRNRHAQVADDPLHNSEVVHHLYEGDEEDDGRKLYII